MAIRRFRDRVRAKRLPADHVDAVIENGLQFVERGANELWAENDAHHLKHSVINFYSGVELLLKARLMRDHWALIVADIGKADSDNFMKGDFQSVGFEDALARLKKISGVEIVQAARDSFNELRKHRNQMVHFYHVANLGTVESKLLKEQITKEQCAGWFYLRRLLQEAWQESFADFQHRIDEINGHMKRHKAYLDIVYDKIKSELVSETAKGTLLGSCYSCGYEAHVVEGIGPSPSRCRVCTASHSFLAHKCDGCELVFLIPDGLDEKTECPRCSEPVTPHELLEAYSEEGRMLETDRHEAGGYGNCAECGGYHIVGSIGDEDSFCFFCHTFQGSMDVCGYCGEKATGDLEDSYATGCVMCDGGLR